MNSPSLRWGLIGTGHIAKKFARAVNETSSGVLAAAGSRLQATADAFAAEFGIPRAHGSYAALLADPGIDAVYISTPHPMHAEWSIAAARAGKHILCEKPLAMNAAEAGKVAAEAETAGVFLMEAFMYRCHPFVAKAAELVKSGILGEIALIESAFCHRPAFDAGSRLFNRALGSGGILDLGCYPASISRLLAGAASGQAFADPVELTGTGKLSEVTGVDTLATACLRFENGALASLVCGMDIAQEPFVRVHGTLGSLKISNPWFGRPAGEPIGIELTIDGQPASLVETVADRSIYALEADAVAAAIRSGLRESPHMPIADSIGNMRTLDLWLAAAGVSYD